MNGAAVLSAEYRRLVSGRTGLPRLASSLLVGWVLSMISLPILIWTFGDVVIPYSVSLTVVLQVLCVLSVLKSTVSWIALGRIVATVLVAAWAVEWFGSQYEILFGEYDYTNLFVPQFLHVPLLIPLAWLMMLPPAWAVAQAISSRHSGIAFVILSAVAFTAWDLFLDPQMVTWGAWTWQDPGGYYGIPWRNFVGWMVSAAALTLVARPPLVPVRPLLIVYTLTWMLQTIGLGVFWRMPGPALWGFLAMGAFVVLSWRSELRSAGPYSRTM